MAPARDVVKPSTHTLITLKGLTQTFSMDATNKMKKTYQLIVLDAKGYYLIGLEPQRFLDEFMAWNSSTSYAYKSKVPSKLCLKNLWEVAPELEQKESVVYKPFVSRCLISDN